MMLQKITQLIKKLYKSGFQTRKHKSHFLYFLHYMGLAIRKI